MIKHLRTILFPAFILLTLTIVSAQMSITPQGYDFGDQQIGKTSDSINFEIQNTGAEPFQVSEETLLIEGNNSQTIAIKIMTLNIWHDSQNWPARLEYILEQIREINPDLIGLQEVIQRSWLPNQAQTLADSLGYYYFFSSVDDEGATNRYGNAILSRYPIIESNQVELLPLNDYRNAGHVKVNMQGNTIDFYNTHLHNTAVGANIREQQITHLLQFIDQTATTSNIFVTGDYNANPNWPEMELMYDQFQDVYPIFHENHLDPEHSTLNYHLGHQQRRIDYIFFNLSAQPLLQALSAEIMLDQPNEEGIYASDHFAMVATFKLQSDADMFVMNAPVLPFTLQPGETANISIQYSPFTIGDHTAWLRIGDAQASLIGTGYDATIYQFPWTEDFTGTGTGSLPFGWENPQQAWSVQPTENAGGTSPELVINSALTFEEMAIVLSPLLETTGLDSIYLSFRHSLQLPENEGTQIAEVILIHSEGIETLMTWTDPTTISQETLQISLYSSTHAIGSGAVQLGWIISPDADVEWSIDDVMVEAGPAIALSDENFEFAPTLINTTSLPQIFTVSNFGHGILTIEPEDIQLAGDTDQFQLTGINETQLLEHGHYFELQLTFTPTSEGIKTAALQVGNEVITITGLGFDPTISNFPWIESFDDTPAGQIPLGWTSNASNWSTFNAANAGGDAPEMVFWWQPENAGRFELVTPQIVASTTDSLIFSFRYRINDFGPAGNFTLSVLALADGQSTIIHEWINPGSMGPDEFFTLLNNETHGLGDNDFRIAFVFEGTTDNITQWDIDDIQLLPIPVDPILEIIPQRIEFGNQVVGSPSDPVAISIRNIGGGILTIASSQVLLNGSDPGSFSIQFPDEGISLNAFETFNLPVAFTPATPGLKSATLTIEDVQIDLTGNGTLDDYFIYSDFSIAINGITYTNVDGFREVPGWAANSITAIDISEPSLFGNSVLQLDYDLTQTSNNPAYWMWAYPSADISEYNTLVIRVKAETPTDNIRVEVMDTRGVQGTNGAAFTIFDAGTEWHTIELPMTGFDLMDFADELPDMSKIQKINLVFNKATTLPQQGTLWLDVIAFTNTDLGVHDQDRSTSFVIFPNPAHNELTIETHKTGTISIVDTSGRELFYEKMIPGIQLIDVSIWKSGVYFIRLESKNENSVQKLLIL